MKPWGRQRCCWIRRSRAPAVASSWVAEPTLEAEKRDYEGFFTWPMSWERALEKFERLSTPYADGKLIESIVHAIRRPEDGEIRELTELLGRVGKL